MCAPTIYLIPKRSRPTWTPALAPLDLETEVAVELPLLGYISAGRPVETPEDDQTVKVPSHHDELEILVIVTGVMRMTE